MTTIPFDLDSPDKGHIIVVARINGSRPLRLIFDTGGSNLVSPEVAREIGLRGSGSIASGGSGESEISQQLASGATLRIGEATLPGQQVAILPLPASLVAVTGRYHSNLRKSRGVGRLACGRGSALNTLSARRLVPPFVRFVPSGFSGKGRFWKIGA
jgi:hypothetical protein